MTEENFVLRLESYFKNKHYLTQTEVKAMHGVPDLVLGRANMKHVELRRGYSQFEPLLNEKYFRLLKHIPDQASHKKPISARSLAELTDISQSYLVSSLLRDLKEGGYILALDDGYMKVNGWVPILNKIIGIEAKLKDWKRGIYQAVRYKKFADEAYLAMPSSTSHLVDRELLGHLGVGLLVFDYDKNQLVEKLRPSKKNTTRIDTHSNFVAENLATTLLVRA